MSGRTNGLATFFSIAGVGPGGGLGLGLGTDYSGTPAHTVPNTPAMASPVGPSRRTSLDKLDDDQGKPHTPTIPSRPHSVQSFFKVPSPSIAQRHLHSHSHSHSHSYSRPHQRTPYDKPHRGHEIEHAVGTFENQRYLNLEATRLWDPHREEWTRKAMQLLGERWVCFLLGLETLFLYGYFFPTFSSQPLFLRLVVTTMFLFHLPLLCP